MEQLLQTHGGGYKTDFGLRGTIDFDDGSNRQGWNRLFEYIQGKVNDQRIEHTIQQMRNQKSSVMSPTPSDKFSPFSKPANKPESLTDVTRQFLTNIQLTKNKKNKKIKAIKMIKNFKQKKKATRCVSDH